MNGEALGDYEYVILKKSDWESVDDALREKGFPKVGHTARHLTVPTDMPVGLGLAGLIRADEKEAILNLLQERMFWAHGLDNEIGNAAFAFVKDIVADIKANKHRDKEADGSSTT